MEGVRILNEISPMSAGIYFCIGLFIAFGILILSLSLIATLDKKSKFIPILVSLIPFIFAVALFFTKYTSPMKYEAIIDDNVKISEFERKNIKLLKGAETFI